MTIRKHLIYFFQNFFTELALALTFPFYLQGITREKNVELETTNGLQ